jgi:polyferredoxin
MSPDSHSPPPSPPREIQHRRTLIVLAWLLIVGGLAIIFFLERMLMPMRILIGLTDIFAGLGLLILVRQKR